MRSPSVRVNTSVVTVLDRYGHLLPELEDRVNRRARRYGDSSIGAAIVGLGLGGAARTVTGFAPSVRRSNGEQVGAS